jgi:hypothetical protein
MSEGEQPDDEILAVPVSDDEVESTCIQTRPKKARHERGSRMIVDYLHLATLMAAYHKYFSDYSNGRKHATKQIIPSKVWGIVYEDYKEEHPASVFDQETLKGRVGETLEQLQTGTSNSRGGPETLQSSEFLKRIKATDAHATRSIISLRHTIVKNKANSGNRPTSSDSTGSGPIGDLDPVLSKSACLLQQTSCLEKMSKDFATSVSNQKEFMAEKRVGAKFQNLKLQMDSGVLSHEEFSKHARVVAGIDINP